MREIQVSSGECLFAYKKNMWMQTVVGTCVTVCIWDKENHSGGMCHYRLPVAPESIALGDNANDYGSCAIPNLLRKFKHTASIPQNLCAWVLGGGQINDGEFAQAQQIGERNIAVAFELLAHYGLPIFGVSVGDRTGRQVRFNPFTGDVDFRLVEDSANHPPARGDMPKRGYIAAVAGNVATKTWIENALSSNFQGFVESFDDFEDVTQRAKVSKPRVLIIDSKLLPIKNRGVNAPLGLPAVVVSDTLSSLPISVYKNLEATLGNYSFISSAESLPKVLETAISLTHQQQAEQDLEQSTAANNVQHRQCRDTLIFVGSSTGGVDALETVLKDLPQTMPPIFIVQHIPEEYSSTLVKRLNTVSKLTVVEAADGEVVKESMVYFAPGGHHIKVAQLGDETSIVRVTRDAPLNNFRPSVDYLFQSALKIQNKKIVAVLMTGMGSDGAGALKSLKDKGALTLIQDEASSAVFGMARVAKEIDAVCRTIPLIGIAPALVEATGTLSLGHSRVNEEEY
ncbi:hypothetical protein LRP49_18735 [Enterovibrio sp. ZSDZ35]|uniref:Probable chemoreceptor glutamine deamidase CheD n=1 Tax=Enterovibrio qingdaonensis TaxID=2899818 RepID=A0ABT5QQE6_9GAMM|nr:chemotaxis protein CheB [Enterovibrio sp. ZSDZ35]MDD1783208.1 hypothetical protein [Enterovibrio sp. ZSDZ35]